MNDKERTFPATMEGLADASEFLMSIIGPSDCPPKVKSAVMVAMDEIASNIVHYSGAPDFTVSVGLPDAPPYVRLTFSDGGKPYNPLQRADPDVTLPAEERAIGGLGIFMVKKMMDDIEYAYENGRNVLTIGKKRS